MQRVVFAAACCAALAGCGYVGDPQPPTLDIPVAISDLQAMEYGDSIVVAFTLPVLTTEGQPLKNPPAAELFAGPGAATVEDWVTNARRIEIVPDKAGRLEHEIPARDFVGRSLELRVRTTGPKGKKSNWSNLVVLSVVPPLAIPGGVRAQNVAQGVALSWQGAGPRYRIFRATEGGQPQAIGESETPMYVDETTIYGIRYDYMVQALASESQQGALSAPVTITPEDVFPPAVPRGLTGIAAARSIELTWERNTEEDFAAYNVYRSLDDQTPSRIAAGVDSVTFSDTQIESGKRYRYQITSVDRKGNESARSEPVEIVAP